MGSTRSIRPGLVSVSFRKLSPPEIIRLAVENGLEAIEWGGDVHVPHGQTETAAEVGRQTRDAGIQVAGYGSYYRCGSGGPDPLAVILSAEALRAPLIRVWAGQKGSAESTEQEFEDVRGALLAFSQMALGAGIGVTVEFHPDTLADTHGAALRLVCGCPNVGINWQPGAGELLPARTDSLRAVVPFLTNLHVFNWRKQGGKTLRAPLAEAGPEWLSYLELATGSRYALLEFMPANTPEELPAEAATLHSWLASSTP